MSSIALAAPGIFPTIQGEGHLTGQPMTFVRLAGCSVGCAECDTDYRVAQRETIARVVEVALRYTRGLRDRWVWISGGEPTDHTELPDLVRALKAEGLMVALATSGVRPVTVPVDWLSVSPHGGYDLAQRYGNEIKLVPGLNGLDAGKWIDENESSIDFWLRFLQPCEGVSHSIAECHAIRGDHPNWGISIQAHKILGVQ